MPRPGAAPPNPESSQGMRRPSGVWRARLASWGKLIFPLLALVILSTLFLMSRQEAPDPLPYVQAEARIAEGTTVTAPSFATVTQDGASLRLDAATTRQDGTAQTARLTLRPPSAPATDLIAGAARMAGEQITLSDGVKISTSDGWILTTPTIESDPEARTLNATQGVAAKGPIGTLSADRMTLSRQGGEQTLDFTGRVRLIYQPNP